MYFSLVCTSKKSSIEKESEWLFTVKILLTIHTIRATPQPNKTPTYFTYRVHRD